MKTATIIHIVLLMALLAIATKAISDDLTNIYKKGSLEAVSSRLEMHPEDLNKMINDRGDTPLSAAVATNRDDVVAYLLECGADPQNKKNNRFTPLMVAAQETSNPKIINILVKALNNIGQHSTIDDVDHQNGYTALMYAARYAKDERIVVALLNNCANPFIQSKEGKATALSLAKNNPVLLQHNAAFQQLTLFSDSSTTHYATCLEKTTPQTTKTMKTMAQQDAEVNADTSPPSNIKPSESQHTAVNIDTKSSQQAGHDSKGQPPIESSGKNLLLTALTDFKYIISGVIIIALGQIVVYNYVNPWLKKTKKKKIKTVERLKQ